MTGKRELKGICDQMGGEWREPGDPNPDYPDEELEDGVYTCDMGKSNFTLFVGDEAPHNSARDEVVFRESDGKRENRFAGIDPYQVELNGSTLQVHDVDGRYYDGYSQHRIENGTIRIHDWDGGMEVEQTMTY